MEGLVRIDEALIDGVEKALFSVRNKLGLSFPQAVSLCGSITIVMMALSVFLSSGDLMTVKIPLLILYAVLAFAMSKTVFRHLSHFDETWTPEAERVLAKNAVGNRERLRPVRALFWAFSLMSAFLTLTLSAKLLGLGAISPLNAGRDMLSNLLGFPALLAFQYIMCSRPSGRTKL
ncbi:MULTISPECIES: hypothetical protein [Ensifer]|jgi:hypothetical protein|uniref:hypothetical protein n=1 Tax=Ensifer TaxID=106591 RepID=UPI0007132197|nr:MULTISPECIES: hypothetical protein [Ensifer]KQX56007.1 hypothetical protein ASD49_24915 [Ensifer sp. Root1298]KQX91840.1 hypothetical protein ASD41_23605 [Ensifer sp. Root1312]KRC26832.1 hypothetical protein ASE29_21285 [Ensifer sp. Root74]KRD71970.1 hypothetical protein ASE71_22595 [Ensifer sp. Root954]